MMDCGYSFEPSLQSIYVFSKNKKNIKSFQLKIAISTAVKIAVYCIGVLS